MTGGVFRPEYQVKQFVAVVHGQHAEFMVFETGAPGFYLFAPLYPGTLTQTGLHWPVRKADLRDDVRHGLANGVGYQAVELTEAERAQAVLDAADIAMRDDQ